MLNQNLIDKVQQIRTTLNEISVYNLDVKTSLELYYELAKKVNEVINELIGFEGDVVEEVKNFETTVNNEITRFENLVSEDLRQQNEKITYMLDEGLKLEVGLKIDDLIQDGTIDSLINHKIFNDLNTKIETYKQQTDEQFISIEPYTNIMKDFMTNKPIRIAHRCCGYIYPSIEEGVKELNVGNPPENSISALYNCVETGLFWGVEIDIKPCNDKWVVIHDGDLKRTHNGDAAIVSNYNSWNLNTKYYATTNPGASDFRYNTEGIATLADFLYCVKSLNTNVIIEIKTTYFKDGFLDKLYEDVKSNYMFNNVIFMVSTVEMCNLVRSKFGNIPLILILDNNDTEKINYLKSNINMIALLHTTIVSSLKDELNANKIPWMLYGINTIDSYKYYSNLGVSAILTDKVIGGER